MCRIVGRLDWIRRELIMGNVFSNGGRLVKLLTQTFVLCLTGSGTGNSDKKRR